MTNPGSPLYRRDHNGRRISIQRERYAKLSNLDRVRALVLPTLIYRALREVHREDASVVREDVMIGLSRAAQLPLMDVDQATAMELQAAVLDLVEDMLRAMMTGSAREAVVASCVLILKLAAEGRVPANDVDSQAVLVATSIAVEAQENPDAGWGRMTEGRVALLASRAADRAAASGIPLL